MMTDAATSSETSVFYVTTRYQNPEDLDLNLHDRGNLKVWNIKILWGTITGLFLLRAQLFPERNWQLYKNPLSS
jgi:hypothetical protein